MLHIKQLTKKFGSKIILNNINLDIQRGHIAVLLGKSGVGKSTLLRALCNLEKIDHGSLILDNKQLNLAQVNHNHTVGMVFQQFNLFEHMTVLENITLALELVQSYTKKEAVRHAELLLQHYGLLEKKDAYPSGLSGGQKQRLAIARALALNPKIICFDEPTSALDPFLTNHVATTIANLAKEGLIVMVATHDVSLVEQLPCTIHLMSEGEIVESAASVEFYKHKEKFPKINAFISGNQL